LIYLYYVKILIYFKLIKNSISEKNNAYLYGLAYVIDISDFITSIELIFKIPHKAASY